MRIIAHRGASAEAPENTLAAFRRALDLGAAMIELDVHLTADGVPVVIHDSTLSRTTDGEGRVGDLSLEEIRRYSAGRWFGEAFAAEKVPALAEVYELVGDRAEINVEIKGESGAAALAALEVAREAAGVGRTLFSAFDPAALQEIRSASGEARLALLTDAASLAAPGGAAPLAFHGRVMARIGRWEGLSLEAANLQRHLAAPETVSALHALGLRVYVFTVDGEEAVAGLERLGVDGVFANDPGALIVRWPAGRG